MTNAKGLIAEMGSDRYRHRFGGTSWTIHTPFEALPQPVLLLTLDASDPRVCLGTRLREVPLCSRVDGDSLERQAYVFDSVSSRITYEGVGWHVEMDPEDRLPSPLAERNLHLRPTTRDEDVEFTSKYTVQDTFLGGAAFIRVRGQPLWLQGNEDVRCKCGQETEFIACIGYENYDRPTGIVSRCEPFFLGELALYFFICIECQRVVVVTQST